MAVYLDLENIALGARDAKYPSFDIEKVLARLLLKGHIVVKKAYCDFDRYKDFKRGLHEAAFELIEIPHVRQSGKNSADIRMVVDALDLCYTKGHVDTFVILSGDSDFSPLVSKLRENAKTVIGVGVKNSTSDLFLNNCDEFIYYDDLVRKEPSKVRRRSASTAAPRQSAQTADTAPAENAPAENKGPDLTDALDLVVETLEAVIEEAGKFCENEIQPLNLSGDSEGCHFENGVVRTPKGFKEAYDKFREGGWVGLTAHPEYGGQGLPHTMSSVLDEMVSAANTWERRTGVSFPWPSMLFNIVCLRSASCRWNVTRILICRSVSSLRPPVRSLR